MNVLASVNRFFSRHYDLLAFSLALILGGFLLFSNLSGAIYLTEDEARPFQLLTSGQLIFLLSDPIHTLFGTQASVFYLVATLNFLSLILFFILCRVSVGRVAASFATLLYAVYPLRIDYARTFYPAAFMEPFFILSVLSCYLALSRRELLWMLLCGAAMACVFFVHYMGYALIAGVALAALYYQYSFKPRFSPRQFFFSIFNFLLGFSFSFILITEILSRIYHYSFDSNLKTFYSGLPAFGSHTVSLPLILLFFAGGIVAFGTAAYFFKKNKSGVFGFFLTLFAGGAGLLAAMAFLGRYWIFERHFVWLVSFYCLTAGVLMAFLLKPQSPKSRIAGVFFFLVLAVAFGFRSYEITRETFHITPITRWLREHDIPKRLVLTTWKLREPSDKAGTSSIPTYLDRQNFTVDPDGRRLSKTRILWPRVYQAYQAGLCRYLLTSGISDPRFGLGENESLLKNVPPLALWPHPYSHFSHRSFFRPGTSVDIKLYSLDDVFSQKDLLRRLKIG